MKITKIIIVSVFLILLLNYNTTYADNITYTNTDTLSEYDPSDYLPPEVTDRLSDNNISAESTSIVASVIEFIISALKEVVISSGSEFSSILGVIITTSLIKKIIDNNRHKMIISYISVVYITFLSLDTILNILKNSTAALQSLKELLSSVIPAFSAILLLSGNSFTSITSTASLGAVLTLLDILLTSVLVPVVTILIFVTIFEKISPGFAEIKLMQSIKKSVNTLITFITTVMITVLGFQNILSSSKDSLSARTVKFATSNFIPIVGGAIGESLRTVSAGIKFLKSTVGTSVCLAIISVVLPTIIEIFFTKTMFSFFSFSCGILGNTDEKGLFESLNSIFDIISAIIICVAILSILIMILFITTSVAIGG